MQRRVKVVGVIFFVGFVTGLILWLSENPYKITDLSNLNFKIDSFRFEDYRDKKHLDAALEKIFTVGSDKKFLDNILVDKLGSYSTNPFTRPYAGRIKPGKAGDQYLIIYFKPVSTKGIYGWDESSSGWVLEAEFSNYDELMSIATLTIPNWRDGVSKNVHVKNAQHALYNKLTSEESGR